MKFGSSKRVRNQSWFWARNTRDACHKVASLGMITWVAYAVSHSFSLSRQQEELGAIVVKRNSHSDTPEIPLLPEAKRNEGSKVARQMGARPPDQTLLRPDYLERGSDDLWIDLLEHGRTIVSGEGSNKPLVAMEIGVHSVKQCKAAAIRHIHAHCFEPSPASFERITGQVRNDRELEEYKNYLHLYNVAAGNVTGGTLEFHTSKGGSTGDHVGNANMYSMEANAPDGDIVHVPSVRLDDVVLDSSSYRNKIQPVSVVDTSKPSKSAPKIDEVYAIKVDTQGFEPSVFAGMSESIRRHKFQHILFEFWPKAMDLMAGSVGGSSDANICNKAVEILELLDGAGYKLYPLTIGYHPKQVATAKERMQLKKLNDRPLHDFRAHCMYLRLELERRVSETDCKMGFWTDFLAIAPNVDSFLEHPKGR